VPSKGEGLEFDREADGPELAGDVVTGCPMALRCRDPMAHSFQRLDLTAQPLLEQLRAGLTGG
jgi:hypothetical protein